MRTAYVFFMISAILLASACKTTRKKNEISGLAKFYHNTTAKYNGYFNANVLVEEAIYQLDHNYEDNFNQLIPIYKWHKVPNVERQFSALDTAIKKVSVVVSLHEPSLWTDDCYLLAGKAHYIKRDYEAAEETLEYLLTEFDPSDPSSRFWDFRQDEIRKEKAKEKKAERKERKAIKKAREKARKEARKIRRKQREDRIKARKRGKKPPESKSQEEIVRERVEEVKEKFDDDPEDRDGKASLYGPNFDADDYSKMGHTPAYKKGQLWLARTYIERDNYSNALNLLRKLIYDPKLDRDLKEQTHVAMAEMFIQQREYDAAIPHLEKALNFGRDRQQNARYAFIIGQLSQQSGQSKKAGEYFSEAGKLSSDYNLEFAADLSQVKNEYFAGTMSKRDALDQLEKMTRDSKNDEYLDFIYYTMAEVAKESGDLEGARSYLAEALKNSRGNQSISLEAYYSLGTYFFEQDDFDKAKLYYDSIMQVIPKSDARFTRVKQRHQNLKVIDQQQQILNANDSALIIANMSPAEKQQLIKEKRQALERKEQKRREKELEEKMKSEYQGPVASSKPSDFFAYDNTKVRRGMQDFEFQWGERGLTDNWRRNNEGVRRGESVNESEEDSLEAVAGETPEADEEVKGEQLLGEYPKTKAEIAAVRQKVIDAMYSLAEVYRERMDRPDLAVLVLEDLVQRFPRSNKEVEALYSLVLAYRELGEQENEKKFEEVLLERYPDSRFAKILKNPEYAEELRREAKEAENHYEKTFELFQNGNYERALNFSEKGLRMGAEDEEYMPKFMLIKAMSIGKTKGKDAYLEALTALVKTYERSDEAARAREIIRFLQGEESAFVKTESQMGDFKAEDDKMHYVFAVLYNSRELDINRCKVSISDFNREYYGLKDLAVSNIFLDLNSGIPLIIVRSFKNKKEAMRYYQTAKQEKEEFLPSKANYDLFAATQRNYRGILKQRTIEGYRPFFEEYYLRTD